MWCFINRHTTDVLSADELMTMRSETRHNISEVVFPASHAWQQAGNASRSLVSDDRKIYSRLDDNAEKLPGYYYINKRLFWLEVPKARSKVTRREQNSTRKNDNIQLGWELNYLRAVMQQMTEVGSEKRGWPFHYQPFRRFYQPDTKAYKHGVLSNREWLNGICWNQLFPKNRD